VFHLLRRRIFRYGYTVERFLGKLTASQQVLRNSPGWYLLSWLQVYAQLDFKWFYLLVAAVFLVASIPHIPLLKRFFETPFNQYLGSISYSFYLVHGPVLWTLGDRIYAAVGWPRGDHGDVLKAWTNLVPLPKTGPLGLELGFLLPHLLILPVTFWVAEISTKLFDGPSVSFSRWFYKKTLRS